jgi:alanyl-tRNA synthetase
MQDAYPELKETAERTSRAIHSEETRFSHTLELGLEKLEELIRQTLALRRHRALEQVVEDWRRDRKDCADEVSRVITVSEPNLPTANEKAVALLLAQLRPTLGLTRGADFESQILRALASPGVVPGADAFKLYDTYGLPRDFIEDAVLAATAAKFSQSSARARVRKNSNPATKAKSSLTTHPSTPNLAVRLAIADGSTAMITTPWSPR